jgi:hypothetical protein
MKLGWDGGKWLKKKAKLGFRGYPIGTIAFYGPTGERASKAVASIVVAPESEPIEMRSWFAEDHDVRADPTIFARIAAYLRENGAHSVAMTDAIIGCPHQEGIDYPLGETCPRCPYWAGRDRWAGVGKT